MANVSCPISNTTLWDTEEMKGNKNLEVHRLATTQQKPTYNWKMS